MPIGDRKSPVMWVVEKTLTKKQEDTIVEFTVVIVYNICTQKEKYSTTTPTQKYTDSGSHNRSPLLNWSTHLMPFHQLWIYMVGKKHSE